MIFWYIILVGIIRCLNGFRSFLLAWCGCFWSAPLQRIERMKQPLELKQQGTNHSWCQVRPKSVSLMSPFQSLICRCLLLWIMGWSRQIWWDHGHRQTWLEDGKFERLFRASKGFIVSQAASRWHSCTWSAIVVVCAKSRTSIMSLFGWMIQSPYRMVIFSVDFASSTNGRNECAHESLCHNGIHKFPVVR